MSNEVVKLEQIENEISIIEESHKSAILSIHENMQQLVNDCLTIEVDEDDKQKYDTALELKRVVKATHVSIEKKRKELKQPLIDYGKRLDKWVEEIYTPLVNAEKIVKKKMEVYEAKQAQLKEERKLADDQKQKEEAELEFRLKNLNAQLEKINSAKNKTELKEIEVYLDSIILSDFGSKSNEAGFILNQLKLTCTMASRLMKDEEEKIVEAPKMETTPITDDFLNELKAVSSEPAKKVVIEEPVVVGEKALETPIQEPVVVGEKALETPIQEEKQSETIKAFSENGSELSFDENGRLINEVEAPIVFEREANDEDVISLVDLISEDVISNVINLIDERTKLTIENKEVFDKLDLSVYKQFIHQEVKIRVGVLLKNNQLK